MIPTSYLLYQYEKKYPDIEFSCVIGSDLIPGIQEWEDYENFLKFHSFHVFHRGSCEEE